MDRQESIAVLLADLDQCEASLSEFVRKVIHDTPDSGEGFWNMLSGDPERVRNTLNENELKLVFKLAHLAFSRAIIQEHQRLDDSD